METPDLRNDSTLLIPDDTTVEVASVDLISVSPQVTRCRVPRKGVEHLLCRPLGRRMFRHFEMNDTATVVAKHYEDKKNAEGCGRHREEVYRRQVAQMIVEKAPPRLGRWLRCRTMLLDTVAWE